MPSQSIAHSLCSKVSPSIGETILIIKLNLRAMIYYYLFKSCTCSLYRLRTTITEINILNIIAVVYSCAKRSILLNYTLLFELNYVNIRNIGHIFPSKRETGIVVHRISICRPVVGSGFLNLMVIYKSLSFNRNCFRHYRMFIEMPGPKNLIKTAILPGVDESLDLNRITSWYRQNIGI